VLTDSQILKYEVILFERDDLVLTTDTCLNPTSFPWKGEESQDASEHNCLDTIEYQTRVRPDLSEVPLYDGSKLFVDGSSWVIEGNRHNGVRLLMEPNAPYVRKVDYLMAG
jgi:hypothetical protein